MATTIQQLATPPAREREPAVAEPDLLVDALRAVASARDRALAREPRRLPIAR